MEKLPEPINMTDKYLYDIAKSLRDICSRLGEEEKEVVKATPENTATETMEFQLIDKKDCDKTGPEELTVPELRNLVKQTGLTGYSSMVKDELIEYLLKGE